MRTTLVDADGNPKYTNRLASESSPYLVQHAHNPVDWYPWGDEAFARAREEDKPVFLSIGYSTCHWCHVMEVESFDDEEIADFLNRHFVSIKLDREQRPDIDDVYMTGVQMLTGQGGWPMSNFLTPDGKPFFAGTYYPPQNFIALLRQIENVWRERREDVEKQAEEISDGIRRFTAARSDARELGEDLCGLAAAELFGRFDDANGGFGGAPKFPNESMLSVMLEDWQRNGNDSAFDVLELTLDKMYQGGIYDQVCGGFHRYAVDAVWLVPHFEKMLYNQAQLVRLYSRASVLAGKDAWRRVAEQTVDYVLRDMRATSGAFFSATDADSEGEEGRFFVWTPDEMRAVLDDDEYELAVSLYGVTREGNFEGANILHLSTSLEAFADQRGETLSTVLDRVRAVDQRLYEAREKREHPLRDEKIITAWNAMMITALAWAGFDLGRDDYVAAGERAARVLWERMFEEERGELWRILYEDEVSIPGNLEDYACFSEALLVLYAVTGERAWLQRGRAVTTAMIERFADDEAGGFFLSRPTDDGPMITRPKSPMDGATPSGNSVAVTALVLLHSMSGDLGLEEKIVGALNGLAGLLHASPSAFSYLIVGVEPYLRGAMGRIRFAGEGHIRLVAHPGRVRLDIADGWHVNADEVADDTLIPTRVVVDGDAAVEYPPTSNHRFEGSADIRIEGDADVLDITLQPCNEDVCLAPETHHFDLR